jgi:dTMP kinase
VLNEIATHHIKPNITFYLKIDPKEAEKRTVGNLKDRMENAGSEFFSKVSNGYNELAAKEERIHSIDATLSPQEMHSQIVKIIERYL